MANPYTIELNLAGRLAVVVGLGAVGRRKLDGLLSTGARIRAIDPHGLAGEVPEGVEIVADVYQEKYLEGASLVFAAAFPEVNAKVISDAQVRGIWVNTASEPSAGDFTVPAVWTRGKIRLTVSTSGASPALAASLRDRAALAIGPAAADLAQLFAEMRAKVLAEVSNSRTRNEILKSWGDPKWLELAEMRGMEAVEQALIEQIQAQSASNEP